MTQRCKTCRRGYMEPPVRGVPFYACSFCSEEVFWDDYSDSLADRMMGKVVTAVMSVNFSDPTVNIKKLLHDKVLDYKAALIRSMSFPGREQTHWSGTQVIEWLNASANDYEKRSTDKEDIRHVNAAIYREVAQQFPSMLRKQWTSLEVHEWIENLADNTQVHYDKNFSTS